MVSPWLDCSGVKVAAYEADLGAELARAGVEEDYHCKDDAGKDDILAATSVGQLGYDLLDDALLGGAIYLSAECVAKGVIDATIVGGCVAGASTHRRNLIFELDGKLPLLAFAWLDLHSWPAEDGCIDAGTLVGVFGKCAATSVNDRSVLKDIAEVVAKGEFLGVEAFVGDAKLVGNAVVGFGGNGGRLSTVLGKVVATLGLDKFSSAGFIFEPEGAVAWAGLAASIVFEQGRIDGAAGRCSDDKGLGAGFVGAVAQRGLDSEDDAVRARRFLAVADGGCAALECFGEFAIAVDVEDIAGDSSAMLGRCCSGELVGSVVLVDSKATTACHWRWLDDGWRRAAVWIGTDLAGWANRCGRYCLGNEVTTVEHNGEPTKLC